VTFFYGTQCMIMMIAVSLSLLICSLIKTYHIVLLIGWSELIVCYAFCNINQSCIIEV